MHFGSASSESGSEDHSIIRLVCLRVLATLLVFPVAWVVRDGAKATWHTTFNDILPAGCFANNRLEGVGAWVETGGIDRGRGAGSLEVKGAGCAMPVAVLILCRGSGFVHVVLFT